MAETDSLSFFFWINNTSLLSLDCPYDLVYEIGNNLAQYSLNFEII